jgi:hypothetical protein
MQPDLKVLEITSQEIINLTGLDADKGFKPPANGMLRRTAILLIPAWLVSAIFLGIIFDIIDPSYNSDSDGSIPNV